MVEHVVLIKWKEGADPHAISAALEGLKRLRHQIPGIVDLSCGENFCIRSQGFQCGLVVRFQDRAALEAYGPHPAHQDVVLNLLTPIREDLIAVDYEIGA